MFLTGQRVQFPWDQRVEEEKLKKNHNYYKTQNHQNLWHNEYRVPGKLFKDLKQQGERYVKSPKAEDRLRELDRKEGFYFDAQKIENLKLMDKSRLAMRRLERQLLQHRSKQAFTPSTDIAPVTQFLEEQPLMSEELILRRSNTFKDPQRNIAKDSAWQNVNKFPSSQIDKIFRPKVLSMDRSGIERIVQKMQIEKEIKDFQKNWVQANRETLRQSLMMRHQYLKELERRSGVKDVLNNYDNIRSFSVADQRVGGGAISPTTENASPRPFKSGQQTPATDKFPRFNIESPSPVHSPKRESEKLTPRDTIREIMIPPPSGSFGLSPVRQAPKTASNALRSSKEQNDLLHTSDSRTPSHFRFPSAGKPSEDESVKEKRLAFKNQKNMVNRLSKPKKEFEPDDMMKHSDFRGMIRSEFRDALKNCGTVGLSEEDFSQTLTMIPSAKASKRKSIATIRGLFPLPAQTFSFSPESLEARKGIGKKTSMTLTTPFKEPLSPTYTQTLSGKAKFENYMTGTSSKFTKRKPRFEKDLIAENILTPPKQALSADGAFSDDQYSMRSGQNAPFSLTSTNFFVAPHLLTTRKIDLSKEHQMIKMARKVFEQEEQDRELAMQTLSEFERKSKGMGGMKGYSKAEYKESIGFTQKYVNILKLRRMPFPKTAGSQSNK